MYLHPARPRPNHDRDPDERDQSAGELHPGQDVGGGVDREEDGEIVTASRSSCRWSLWESRDCCAADWSG
jgi:hypothetical protein